MTFRGQVRWALTRGLAAGALGVVLAFAAVIFEAQEWPFWQDAAGFAAVGLICGGALLVLGGAFARPLQRWAFRHGLPSGRLRTFVLARPVLRWWVWADADGHDRDER
jgi:hypothetical protein